MAKQTSGTTHADPKAKAQPQASTEVPPEFAIQKIYVKDFSFEAPHTPDIFRVEWKPKPQADINVTYEKIEDGVYEVRLKITLTAKVDEKVAFLVEVQQAGIFTVNHFPEDQKERLLRAYCANILFPYAREVITNKIVNGGFPPLYLAPINFEAIYQQEKDQRGSG